MLIKKEKLTEAGYAAVFSANIIRRPCQEHSKKKRTTTQVRSKIFHSSMIFFQYLNKCLLTLNIKRGINRTLLLLQSIIKFALRSMFLYYFLTISKCQR